MNTLSPSIAVVMIVKNGSRCLPRAIASIKAQTLPPTEIIILNNASTDDTDVILRKFASEHPTCKLLSAQGSNLSELRNRANAVVSSDYIAVLDADDELLPHAIATYANGIAEHGAPDLLYGHFVIAYPDRRLSRQLDDFDSDTTAFTKAILGRAIIPFKHSAMVYRRTSLEKIGGYCTRYPRKIDVYVMLEFLRRGYHVVNVGVAVALHHKHSDQVSLDRVKHLRIWYRLIDEFEKNILCNLYFKLTRTIAELTKWILRS